MQRIVDRYSLTPMQLGMLFHHLSARSSGVDLEQILCRLPDPLDLRAFRRAWERVVARHAAFRTRFRWEGVDEPVQEVLESVTLPWAEHDWSAVPESERESRLREAVEKDRALGFDPANAPLVRVTVFRFGDADFRVLWSFHHLLLDGRSFPIVLKELFAFTDAEREGTPFDPPAPPAFREHVERVRSIDLAAARTFWSRHLDGFDAPTPLPGGPAPAAPGAIRLSKEETSRLRALAGSAGVTMNTIVQAGWALLLSRYAGKDDVLFGATRACRKSSVEGADGMVGLFINTLPVRVRVPEETPVRDWLKTIRTEQREVWPFEGTPLADLQSWSAVPAGTPLFETLLVFDTYELSETLGAQGGPWSNREFTLFERTGFPLTLYANDGPELRLRLACESSSEAGDPLLARLRSLLVAFAEDPSRPVGGIDLLTADERTRLLKEWNATDTDYPRDHCIHALIEEQVRRTPDAPAVSANGKTLTYRELNARANRVARMLAGHGVGPDVPVGVFVDRTVELPVAVLGILKSGGAYLPLDPAFPRERLAFMLEDAAAPVVLVRSGLEASLPPTKAHVLSVDGGTEEEGPRPDVKPKHLAYVIYTSGSTGRPKGVTVEHRNVVNFFAGMDGRVPHEPPGVWLAVTSLSFDISVLELLWTLARGFKVVVAPEPRARASAPVPGALDFSLFYFAADEGGAEGSRYRLLLEGAKFADRNGFAAVWTPERHFHEFGGLYPNPAVTGAAIAAVTERVGIRSGSVVLPLHHPARVAEEWALVDNLSGGRIGISFASGWQPNDFVLRPEAYSDRHARMYDGIETVRRLWRGESAEFPGPDGAPVPVRTLPRPVQKELPVWVTTAGNVETWRKAGNIGAFVLSHLLGQTVDELGEKIRVYREAWKAGGHGPGEGHVTLMVHTFVGDDREDVRRTVREPMIRYLGSSLSLVRNAAAEWTAFKKRADGTSPVPDMDPSTLSESERRELLEFSFERYFETASLFGTPEDCLDRVRKLRAMGVDEIACLIDFGVDTETSLRHLPHLNRLREAASPTPSLGDLIRGHGVTHLQCTPSMASLIVQDPPARAALKNLSTLLIGGEAFPPSLAGELAAATSARMLNMYGPTETTVWSSTHAVEPGASTVPIGLPIANTQIYVVDGGTRPVPPGVPGELLIGGDGVVRGYHRRPELSRERFIPDRFRPETGGRLYRTGDLARTRPDGVLEYLGRMDHQVKLRGYRIELGEIEATLAAEPEVAEAVVVAREDVPGDRRLVAYVVAASGREVPGDALRERLRDRLPDYMIPAHLVVLNSLPLTPNRKVDRRALPPPGAARVVDAPPPAGDVEQTVLSIWKEALGLAEIDREGNFFDLGGHSLLAIKVHRRLKEALGRDLAVTDLFRYPTVRALAGFLGASKGNPDGGDARERAGRRREMMMNRSRRPRAGNRLDSDSR